MTDLVLTRSIGAEYATDAARMRLKARYRAEARFKAYGLIAIALAGAFILVVMTDIVVKGLPAFTQHRMTIDVRVEREAVDPGKTGDPAVIHAGDYQGLVRDALRSAFPDVKDRVGRRQLDALLSSGAGDALRARVVADPQLIGESVRLPLLLSADADLYFKGTGTKVSRYEGRAALKPIATTGEVTITLDREFADLLPERLSRRSTTDLFSESSPSLLLALNRGVVKITGVANREIT
jgi:phosphate transport system permease protein